jgi:hypothetical protein
LTPNQGAHWHQGPDLEGRDEGEEDVGTHPAELGLIETEPSILLGEGKEGPGGARPADRRPHHQVT